jgi:hypothetical protein
LRDAVRKLTERLPLEFRVLYRHFLLRVIDLESLSIEADIPRFLGQFAGVLILIGVFQALGFLIQSGRPHLTRDGLLSMAARSEQSFLAGTMLIAGLAAVATWDNIFPDRRDAMVLGPLPVRAYTVLAAKVASSASLLGIGVLALNCGMGIVLPLVTGGIVHYPRVFAAYWFTAMAASVFIYGAVLTIQGVTAAVLSRRWFLRLSAMLQLAAFALFLSAWALQPSFDTIEELAKAQRLGILARWPAFWFFGLFNETSGVFPIALGPQARLAWVGLAAVLAGAGISLLLCYVRTMKTTIEQPDLEPTRGHRRWLLPLGDQLQIAIVRFSMRSLARSRQHRVVYAFFLAIAFAIAVSTLTRVATSHHTEPVTPAFLMSTLMMMCLAVAGLRSIFSLPVSLKANWVLQVTQLSSPERYIAATRCAMLVLATIPVWLGAAGLALCYRPWHQVFEHLLILALVGFIMTDAALIGVSKIPFACSYLPGKSNVQYMFWAFAAGFTPLAMSFSRYEQSVLDNPLSYAALVAILVAAAAELWLFNRRRARSAVLYYEEVEPDAITTLGIGAWQATGREASTDKGNLVNVSKPMEEPTPGNGS